MKLLLDECVPKRLGRVLTGHHSLHLPALGWSGLRNSRLLIRAGEHGFFALLTVDQRLVDHADRASLSIGVIIVESATNRFEDLQPIVPRILEALGSLKPGQVLRVSAAAITEVPAE